jgi:hypothetical protein
MTSFEQGFAEVERAADSASRSTSKLLAAVKQLSKAAKSGDLLTIEKANTRIASLIDAVREEIGVARDAWPFSLEAEERYLKEAYETELLSSAQQAGLSLRSQDGRLVCSPSVVKLYPAERAVRIDKRRVTSLRPSALVAELRANQARPARYPPQRFLESLYRAYQMRGGDAPRATVVRLIDMYEAFTLRPGETREYEVTDFSRDIYLLDSSGVHVAGDGARMDFPSSSGTRGGKVISFVTPEGEQRTYYGLRFQANTPGVAQGRLGGAQ